MSDSVAVAVVPPANIVPVPEQRDFILLDRSGSMEDLWAEALNSVNAYVAKLAADKVNTSVTLALFDKDQGSLDFNVVRDRVAPDAWKDVTKHDAVPRGMTPLNDAIGRLVSMARTEDRERTAIIVMTDGEENSSRELSANDARRLLDECRQRGWQVIFLGANYDNVRQARSYGVPQAATMDSISASNLAKTMSHTASLRSAYGATGTAMVYSDEDKTRLRGDGLRGNRPTARRR